MAFEEICLLGFAIGGVKEPIVVALFHFSHEEVAGVDLAVYTYFRVRHYYKSIITNLVLKLKKDGSVFAVICLNCAKLLE